MKNNSRRVLKADSEQTEPPRQWLWRTFVVALSGLSVASLGGCFNSSPQKPDTSLATIDKPAQIPCGKPETLQTNLPTAVKHKAPLKKEDEDLWTRLRPQYRLWDIDHPRIDKEIRRLQRSPAAFNALMSRAEPFLHHIVDRVERRGLPAEIALLPAVESGFRPYAYSPDGAAGLWQFMPATGRSLGLQQDWWYDGRRDVLAATDAALDYLERLNKRFDGDWLHTLAAYNAGGGKVSRALRKARKRNASTEFWDLDLPRETDHYVPRLLALAEIIADPGRYGLALPSLENRPYFEKMPVGSQIDLKIASDLAGIPLEDLLVLNPGFNRWSTRPQGPHHLLLPTTHAKAFQAALAKLPANERLRWRHHRIVKGDNLGRIARNYSVSVKAIQQANNLKDHRIRAGKTLVIPLSESITAALPARKLGIPRSRVRYQVRKGDSLYKIARKFNVKIADLRRWNSVGRYIKPGQRLTVFVDPVSQTL
jgi:membrane-bound lytic murein transglycosylase D